MKFYQISRSLFSKVNNITESLEKGLDKVIPRDEKNFSVHKKYMNFLTHRKTALDEPLYKLSAGRSMVEMLGVLAIIGVLSVGAIAGYSKAMFKYKLNKQTEQIGSILDYVTINSDKFTHDSSMAFAILLQKLGIIPVEMIKEDSLTRRVFYDSFGNEVFIDLANDSSSIYYRLYFKMKTTTSGNINDICLNLFQIAQLRSANLWLTTFIKDQENGENTQGNRTVGDTYCSPSLKCLKDLTLSEMNELCNFCDDAYTICAFYILWGRIAA